MSPKRRDEDPWYHVCDCGAKMFAAENPIECVRCGEVLTSNERIKPPWRKRLISVREAGKLLSVSSSKIYEMVEKGEIEHHRIGGAIRFSDENLAELLEGSLKKKREKQDPPCQVKTRSPHLRHFA